LLRDRFFYLVIGHEVPGNTSRHLLTIILMPSDQQSKYYVFTFNNYNEGDMPVLQFRLQQISSYYVMGREVGESGTRHLQGYFELPQRKRFNKVKELLGFPSIHYERRLGTSTEASDYCKKDGDFVEHGTISTSKQGRRTDLEDLHESLKLKRSLTEISDDHFGSFLKYERSIKSYKFLHSNPRSPNNPPSVVVYYGNTGAGKTKAVWDNCVSVEDVWVYPGKGWFDGFEDHPIALFDDFRGSSLELHLLLQVLDRYPLKVRIKGAHVNWNPQEIYLTSNIHPIDWYPNVDQGSRDALLRRITNLVYFE